MKDKSYMLAIPLKEEDITDLYGILKRLKRADGLQVVNADLEDEILKVEILADDETYLADVYPTGFQLPELYRIQHFFPDIDMDILKEKQSGLAVDMFFGEEPLKSYHLQLKLIDAMLPNIIAIIDDSSEKILSGRWVALAAASDIPPAPRYVYTVQAVAGEEEYVWLHSHGLNRCGITELEILKSSKAAYQNHYSVIETMANRMLESGEALKSREPFYIARLSEELDLITTLLPWQEAVEYYADGLLGTRADREKSHNGNTSAIFIYLSFEDYENGRIAPLTIFDGWFEKNPIYLISTNETERMKALAAERLPFLLQDANSGNNKILLKLGLVMDEEFQTESNIYEHIWFELLSLSGDDGFVAKLTQEPYYIQGLHEGHTGLYALDEITDWMIFTPSRRLTPDDVYLLDIL